MRRHPVASYDPRLFDAAGPLSHDPRMLALARRAAGARRGDPGFLARPLPPATEAPEVLTLDELVRFAQNPLKEFARQRLLLEAREPAERPEAREPLALDYLARFKVAEDLLRFALEGGNLDLEGATRARGAARLPPGALGELPLAEILDSVRKIRDTALELRAGGRQPGVEVDLDLGGVRLVGHVDDLYDAGRVQASTSYGGTGRKRIARWVEHLALNATVGARETIAVGKEGECDRLLAEPEAAPLLADLIAAWRVARERPIPLFADASHTYAQARRRGRPHRSAMQDVLKRWGQYGEPDDAARRLLGGRGPDDDGWLRGTDPSPAWSFEGLAIRVFGPLLERVRR